MVLSHCSARAQPNSPTLTCPSSSSHACRRGHGRTPLAGRSADACSHRATETIRIGHPLPLAPLALSLTPPSPHPRSPRLDRTHPWPHCHRHRDQRAILAATPCQPGPPTSVTSPLAMNSSCGPSQHRDRPLLQPHCRRRSPSSPAKLLLLSRRRDPLCLPSEL